MWLEAILTKEDLHQVLEQFAPMEFLLGESGRLLLVDPSEVTLIPEKGLSVVCEATLHWPLLGIDVPVNIHALDVLIHPVVERRAGGEFLVFTITLEHAGVGILPKILDDKITAMVNEELVKKHVELAWNFTDTLSHVFSLPDALISTAALGLAVEAGTVKVTESALGFAVGFRTKVQRRVAADPSAPSPDLMAGAELPVATPSSPEPIRRALPSLASVTSSLLRSGGVLPALAIAAAFALGRVSVRRSRR